MPTVTSQRKKLQLYLITAGLSLAVILLSGELLVRLFLPFNNPDTIRRNSLQYIPSIFARHRLKPLGHMVDTAAALGRTSAGDERYFINDAGYRGPNFVARKPPGKIRIIFVGGSTVFDGYRKDTRPDRGEDWPHLVEQFLRSKGSNVEVINAGIPGHASFDALGQLYSQL